MLANARTVLGLGVAVCLVLTAGVWAGGWWLDDVALLPDQGASWYYWLHGTLVAVMNSGPDGMWPMFLFGFLGVLVITQMHGLGLAKSTRQLLVAL